MGKSLSSFYRKDTDERSPIRSVLLLDVPFRKKTASSYAKLIQNDHDYRVDYFQEKPSEEELEEAIQESDAVFFSLGKEGLVKEAEFYEIAYAIASSLDKPYAFFLDTGLGEEFVSRFGPLFYLDFGPDCFAFSKLKLRNYLEAVRKYRYRFEEFYQSRQRFAYLSYARDDREKADDFIDDTGIDLDACHRGLFYDGAAPSKHRDILEMMQRAEDVVVLITEHSLNPNCYSASTEYPLAKQYGKNVIFLVLGDIPDEKWIPFYPDAKNIAHTTSNALPYVHGFEACRGEKSTFSETLAKIYGIDGPLARWRSHEAICMVRSNDVEAAVYYAYSKHIGYKTMPEEGAAVEFQEQAVKDETDPKKKAAYWIELIRYKIFYLRDEKELEKNFADLKQASGQLDEKDFLECKLFILEG